MSEKDKSGDLKRKHSTDCDIKADANSSQTSESLSQKETKTVPPSKKPKFPLKKITLKLPSKSSAGTSKQEIPKIQPLSKDVAQVFCEDESEEEEEMPVEARIRMRNKGRETPTSSGPNSFGKSRYGFIDRRALQIKQLEALNEMVSGDNEDN